MHRHPAGARDAIRVQNLRAIFETIHRHGPLSRADIAGRLHLSPAAVTNITGELIARELIYEARPAETSGVGRPGILLEVAYDRAQVAGIKLSNVGLTCARTNLGAGVHETTTLPLEDTAPASVIAAVKRALQTVGAQDAVALGLSLPGVVDRDNATVRYSPLLGWDATPIGGLLEQALGMPVVVENDVNALALAEAWFGHGLKHPSFLVVTLGRGIGLGIVLGGEVYRGPFGGAGELGHILLDPTGPETQHARRGTLEAYLSDAALLRDALERDLPLAPGADASALLAHAEAGHPAALDLYRAAGEVLGRALSILTNIFAPSLIVLGGEGMRAAEYLVPEAERVLKATSFGDLGERVRVVVDAWGDDAWARGAAGLAASRYLTRALEHGGGD